MNTRPPRTRLRAVREIAARVRALGKRRIGEQDTKASLITPMLVALGWEVGDLDQVRLEYKSKPRDNPVDFALFLNHERPCVLVEAKALGKNLLDTRWIHQALNYAFNAGAPWCVLTDGDLYCMYRATAHAEPEKRLFWSVRLTERSEGPSPLEFLSRDAAASGTLEECWKAHWTERQVRDALLHLIKGPRLIELVSPACPGVPEPELAAAAGRLTILIDVLEPDPNRIVPPDAHGDLAMLFRAGVLTPPVQLVGMYGKSKDIAGVAHADGSVAVGGRPYPSLSTAALHAMRAAGAPKSRTVSGWEFWRVREGRHQGLTLREVRDEVQRAAGGQGGR